MVPLFFQAGHCQLPFIKFGLFLFSLNSISVPLYRAEFNCTSLYKQRGCVYTDYTLMFSLTMDKTMASFSYTAIGWFRDQGLPLIVTLFIPSTFPWWYFYGHRGWHKIIRPHTKSFVKSPHFVAVLRQSEFSCFNCILFSVTQKEFLSQKGNYCQYKMSLHKKS